jgi:UDP-N-acetylmuramate--alanine ligase
VPVYKRRDMLGALLEGRHVIAVAGTHGKTTTTALIVHLLRALGAQPGYIVGGIMHNTGDNAADGRGPFVIEADEYDNMFHGLRPDTAVVTNIEWDHPDFFATPDDLFQSFDSFAELIAPKSGALIVCGDDPGALRLLERHAPSVRQTYGLEISQPTPHPHLLADALRVDAHGETAFSLYRRAGAAQQGALPEGVQPMPEYLGTGRTALAGRHNLRNILAALSVVAHLQLPLDAALAALPSFLGTGRRFEVMGRAGAVTVINDYAHHPTAIRATLAAARERYPAATLWAVWQPHTYSRTLNLLDAYAESFAEADAVVVTPVYAAREAPPPGFAPEGVAAAVRHPRVHAAGDLADAADLLVEQVRGEAVVLLMSAGDAPRIGERFLAEYLAERAP